MKLFRVVLPVLAAVFALAPMARAYQMIVIDPYTGPYNIYPIASTTGNSFTFAECEEPGQLPAGANYDECFSGQNETGQILTSLEMTIPAISGQSVTCGDFGSGLDIFSSLNCVTNADGSYTLNLSGGDIAKDEIFTIAEEGVTSGFPDAMGTFNTPEPAPALLLSTGLLMGGLLYFGKRRRLLSVQRQ